MMNTVEELLLGIKIIRFVNENNNILIQRHQIGVCFDPDKWTRKSCKELEIEIEEVWQNKLKISKVYNGSKFRFGGFNLANNLVNINLGITCYKDIIGISQSKNVSKWQLRGYEETGDSQTYMSYGLGVGVLTFSKDGYLILICRAEWTGEYPGMIDRPGGHPEPDNVLDKDNLAQKITLQDMITDEIWKSPIEELEAEIGVSADRVKDQALLGIVRNTFHAERPSLEFLTNLDYTSEEIVQIYNQKNHSEADESTTLYLINPQQLELILDQIKDGKKGCQSVASSTIPDIQNFTPALKGAILLWSFIK